MRFPHLAHRSAAAHKLHSTIATTRYEFDSGEGETFSRQPALAYSPRNLSKCPGPSHTPGTAAVSRRSPTVIKAGVNTRLGWLSDQDSNLNRLNCRGHRR